ncbi:MAG: phosphoribosyltransferase family protein [Patescibacteria group bacterium]|nr:hypothetical protein [Patescibacteria group bacterium]
MTKRKITYQLANWLLNYIFPVSCVGCAKNGEVLCAKCLSKIPLANITVDKDIYSVFSYKHPLIKQALWELKFNNNKVAARPLANALYDRILEELQDLEIFNNFTQPLLIPIPLSKERLKERGYNQSELLCKELSFMDSMSFTVCTNVLYKPIRTKQQTKTRGKSERINNLHGCFAVKNPEKIRNQNIILIDDIITTGTTILEAKKVLKQNGAKKIIAFTVAH